MGHQKNSRVVRRSFEPNREHGEHPEIKSRNTNQINKILNEEPDTLDFEKIIARLQRKFQNVNWVRIGQEMITRIISRAESKSDGLENSW